MDEKIRQAMILFNTGEKDQARELFAEIVWHDPNNSHAWYGLALCLDDDERKLYYLKNALKADPSNQRARQLLVELQVQKTKQNFLEELQPGTTIKPNNISQPRTIIFSDRQPQKAIQASAMLVVENSKDEVQKEIQAPPLSPVQYYTDAKILGVDKIKVASILIMSSLMIGLLRLFISILSESAGTISWIPIGLGFFGSLIMVDWALNRYKVIVSETGVSEIHLNSLGGRGSWRTSWEEIKQVNPPQVQAVNQPWMKQAIKITCQHPQFPSMTVDYFLYDYEKLDQIYANINRYQSAFLKVQQEKHQRDERSRRKELETIERSRRKELETIERSRQENEKAYFRRIHRLEDIQGIDPVEFEKLVSMLFAKMGFSVSLTKRSRDEGIDLILSRGGKKSIAQCKRYIGKVGQPVIRDLYGSMVHNRAEDAYLVTTGVITMPAATWAQGKPIHLVDGKTLVEWIETYLGEDYKSGES